jgi:peroxin-10
MVVFPYGTPADILRASQKDEYYLENLRRSVLDIFKLYFGDRIQMQYSRFLSSGADLLYFGLMAAAGSQTLGEEYADILLVHKNKKLDRIRLLLSVFGYLFGKCCIERLCNYVIEYAGLDC